MNPKVSGNSVRDRYEKTTGAADCELRMNAPNQTVTFFKTIDVTNMVGVSKKKNLKFNLIEYKRKNADCKNPGTCLYCKQNVLLPYPLRIREYFSERMRYV